MERVKCFFLEPTDQVRLELRRYSHDDDPKCTNRYGYHNAVVPLCEADVHWDGKSLAVRPEQVPEDDPRWPTHCPCGYAFMSPDPFQLSQDLIYRRLDTNELMLLEEAPIGAMWYSDWLIHEGSLLYRGPDGHCLTVRVPNPKGRGHDWIVDSICSNCDRRNDHEHRCWCRHGDPKTGIVTVDKNGNTCNAGAGSILTSNWHGFLREGYLETC